MWPCIYLNSMVPASTTCLDSRCRWWLFRCYYRGTRTWRVLAFFKVERQLGEEISAAARAKRRERRGWDIKVDSSYIAATVNISSWKNFAKILMFFLLLWAWFDTVTAPLNGPNHVGLDLEYRLDRIEALNKVEQRWSGFLWTKGMGPSAMEESRPFVMRSRDGGTMIFLVLRHPVCWEERHICSEGLQQPPI